MSSEGLNELLGNKGANNSNKPKIAQHSFTVRHDVETKVLLDKIKRLIELTDPTATNVSQGSIVRKALDLLAENMGYDKLEKKYSEFLAHINTESVLNK